MLNHRTAPRIVARRRLPLEQVSALCVRDGGGELVAVGDEEFAVVTAPLRDDGLGADDRRELADVLPEARGKSDWEAVGGDGAGRLFLIGEETADVVVVTADLREHLHTIHLRVSHGPDERARKLLDDNRGPEGMLLLAGGHLLVCKQRKPVLLVEFGPRADAPRGFGPEAAPGRDEAFALSRGDETDLFPLRSWQLRDDDEDEVESANDLAFDPAGRLYAISSRTRCIYEILPAEGGDAIAAGLSWPLPAAAGAGEDRNAEGLAFDRAGRPIVALDVRDTQDNLVLLEALG